jgi:hypothetical protein
MCDFYRGHGLRPVRKKKAGNRIENLRNSSTPPPITTSRKKQLRLHRPRRIDFGYGQYDRNERNIDDPFNQGLQFPIVSRWPEDGIFPHSRSVNDQKSSKKSGGSRIR